MARQRVLDRRLCVAPMMARTDRHFRYLLRLLSRHVLLYTEMVSSGALLRGDAERLLAFHPAERPLALQVGGSDAAELAACARLAEDFGYDEINMNVGCPSPRVRAGRFGACLLAEPERVAECVGAMSAAVAIPVTVKTRIGVDERDSYDALAGFVSGVAAAGCGTFIVHARKAWLAGLSPRENRSVPPLRHDVVHRLKADFPALDIVINGGIRTLAEARRHLRDVDGVMIGREAYANPYFLADADAGVFGDPRPAARREDILLDMLAYCERERARGTPLAHLTRHLGGLFRGEHGARAWRRALAATRAREDLGALLGAAPQRAAAAA